MKNRFLLGLILAAILTPIIASAKVYATHAPSRWVFHWEVYKESFKIKDTHPSFTDQTAVFKHLGGTQFGVFSANMNFEKYGSCNEDKEQELIISINADDYKNASPSTPMPISSGRLKGESVQKQCDIAEQIINQLKNDKTTVSVTTDPTEGSTKDAKTIEEQQALEDSQVTCEGQDEGVGWFLCGIIRTLNVATKKFDIIIFNELKVRQSDFNKDTLAGGQYFQIWSVMRYLAMAFIVVAALVMIISQAIGEGPFDAYSIKKIMPRLLVAIVGITLSWELLNLLIEFTNNLGSGIRALIYAPFGGASAVEAPYDFSLGEGTILSIGAISFGAAALIGLGVPGLFSLAFTAFLAVLIGFAVIIFRKIIIALLVISAPIALVSYVLPNTENIWKLWRGTLSKALLMFPLIMALLASGRVFARISEAGSQSLLQSIVAVIAYYGPYFLIPLTFKFAGGAIAAVSGVAGDRTRGVFDRQKKFRTERTQQNMADLKAGNRYKGQNIFSRRASSALQTASLAHKGGFTLDTEKRRARMQTARSGRTFENAMEFLEKNEAARAIKGDDDKLWAVQNGNSEQEVRAILRQRAPGRFAPNSVELDQATAEVMRFKREAGDSTGRVAATIAQAGSGTGYNYKFNDDRDDMLTAIIAASGDNRSLGGRMLATMRPMALQSGRVDLAGGGFAKQAIAMDARRTSLGGGPAYSQQQARVDILQDVLNSNAGAAVAGKVEAIKHLAPVMKANVDDALASGNEVRAARELAKIAGKYDAAAQIAPQNAEALDEGVISQGIDLPSLPDNIRMMLTRQVQPDGSVSHGTETRMTIRQAMEKLRDDPEFLSMRREYMSTGMAAANAANAAAQQQSGNPLPPAPGVTPPVI